MNAELLWSLILPHLLLLARVSAFFLALPIFGWRALPVLVRAGMILLVTVWLAMTGPVRMVPGAAGAEGLALALLAAREAAEGLAIGLVVHLAYLGVQQGAHMMAVQMGFIEAEIIDPTIGQQSQPLVLFFEMTFVMLFLAAGGHHFLLRIIHRSFELMPLGQAPDVAALVGALVRAGSLMLMLGLKLAAPVLAGFLILSLVLGVLARVLPEMNVLVESFPLRVATGLFLAAAVLPGLQRITTELAQWLHRTLFC